ncbi:MAG: hypothetical protein ACXACA_02905 [Candidatus Ranarchaeia archaeon]
MDNKEPENPCFQCEFYAPKSFGRGWCYHKDAAFMSVVSEIHTCNNFSQRDWDKHLKDRDEKIEAVKKQLEEKDND